MSRWTSK